ncbi:MAG: DeoR/GlpR transcriptional regulator [Rhodoferax sp.]|nr:DeoR/GlpR transcriptional regulator [Rhodoferax sp.]
MLQEERILRIRSLLAKFKRLTIERIAQDMDVSRETARRDVLQLEAQGELRRVHGGVVQKGPEPEPPASERARVNQTEKRAIAKAALKLLQPGQTVFLDAGSTTTVLAEELASLSGLTVITNGLAAALKLGAADDARAPRNTILLLGGRIDANVQATYGDDTVGEIHRHQADIALLSPVGISRQHGATSFEHHEAAVARAMAQQARRVIILADYSKIGHSSRVSYVKTTDIDTIVTDARARALPGFSALQRAGARLVVA